MNKFIFRPDNLTLDIYDSEGKKVQDIIDRSINIDRIKDIALHKHFLSIQYEGELLIEMTGEVDVVKDFYDKIKAELPHKTIKIDGKLPEDTINITKSVHEYLEGVDFKYSFPSDSTQKMQ